MCGLDFMGEARKGDRKRWDFLSHWSPTWMEGSRIQKLIGPGGDMHLSEGGEKVQRLVGHPDLILNETNATGEPGRC